MKDPAPNWLLLCERTTKAINRAFAALASLLVVAIVVLVLLAVGTRISGSPALWPYDIAQFMLVYVVFLGLAPALESGHHVVVELFDRLVPGPLRRYAGAIAMLLTSIFGIIFLWQLWRLTERAFVDNRLAIAAIAVPLKYIYVIGPIGTVQFILTALTHFARTLRQPTDAAAATAQ